MKPAGVRVVVRASVMTCTAIGRRETDEADSVETGRVCVRRESEEEEEK